MIENNTQTLNNSQILPVKDTEGAILVIAGAGSGKTRVLTHRIAHLIKELNVNPDNILAVTFTNKAADEMKRRLNDMVGDLKNMWVCTIHSLCVKILRSCIGQIGYEKNFSIYSEDDKERVLKRIIAEMNLEADKFLKLAKNCISQAKNDDLSPREYKDEYITHPNIGIITEIYVKYEEELKKANALDFDDLLIKTLRLLAENDEIRDYYARKFMYVHIDEFQDTNTVQYKIAKYLSSYHNNIFVVGDDDQSIYGWRGAKISNILDFEKHFKGAKVYKLEQNYRSTKNILNVANLIIKNNQLRKNKTLWTDNETGEKAEMFVANEEGDEAIYVATCVRRGILNGAKASNYAVLMRVNALSRAFEQEFLKYNIPYKVFGGFKFFDRKEIKDLTAYLRLISNPLDNEALLRIINVPRRGIGDKTVNTILAKSSAENLSLYEEIVQCNELPLGASSIARIREFKDLIYNLIIDTATMTISEIVKTVIQRTNYLEQFIEDTEENYDKKMNISELVNSAKEYETANKNATLSEYLSSITLSSDTDDMDASNYVTIATIHAVKGLEFDTVFTVGLDETIFPIGRAVNSTDELEEERRLMYVAITRAKKKLYLTRARSRYLYGNRTITSKSRFVTEIEPLLIIKEAFNPSYTRFQRNDAYSGSIKPRANTVAEEYGYYADEPSRSYGSVKSFSSGYTQRATFTPNKSGAVGKYKSGMKVRHLKFGRGTVIAVKNEGKHVDVAFENGVGIKTLAVEIAPLEIE